MQTLSRCCTHFWYPRSIRARSKPFWVDQGWHFDSGGLLTAHKSVRPVPSRPSPPRCLQVTPPVQQTSCPAPVPSSPMAVTNPGPVLGTCWILHISHWISLQEERSCFQTRSCGFTHTGRTRRLSPTALGRCRAACRLAHFHCCVEETSPFLEGFCLFVLRTAT